MDLSLALQYAVIALAVAASAWVVIARQFPNAWRSLRAACALPLVREGRPAWLRALGRRIAPPSRTAGSCGGCNGCD